MSYQGPITRVCSTIFREAKQDIQYGFLLNFLEIKDLIHGLYSIFGGEYQGLYINLFCISHWNSILISLESQKRF